MTLLRFTLQPGQSIFDQVVFAAAKAFVSGEFQPGQAFPSVRALAADLKIHPNTAHKVVQHLFQERWLESRPGIGTVVAARPEVRAGDRKRPWRRLQGPWAFAVTMHFVAPFCVVSIFHRANAAGDFPPFQLKTLESCMFLSRCLKLASPLLLVLTAAFGETTTGPSYKADGSLVVPADYREWIFLSSGLDMSYSEKLGMQDHSMFDNVCVNPEAWRTFKATGHWPDKTVFVMESRRADSHGSINKHGQYQTEELMGMEFHVRDTARFKDGWGFFAVDDTGPAKLLPASANCYSCHQKNGAVDTTFTQFYPTAKAIAAKAGSLQGER